MDLFGVIGDIFRGLSGAIGDIIEGLSGAIGDGIRGLILFFTTGDLIGGIVTFIIIFIGVAVIGVIVGTVIGVIVGTVIGAIRGDIARGIKGGSQGGCECGGRATIPVIITTGIAIVIGEIGVKNVDAGSTIIVSGIIGSGIIGGIIGAIEDSRARAYWFIDRILGAIIGCGILVAIIGTIVAAGIATLIGVENVNASAIVTMSGIIGAFIGVILAKQRIEAMRKATPEHEAKVEAMLKSEAMLEAIRKVEAEAMFKAEVEAIRKAEAKAVANAMFKSEVEAIRKDHAERKAVAEAMFKSEVEAIRKDHAERKARSGILLNVPIQDYERLSPLKAPAGYVYVIQDVGRTWLYKIGRTTNPRILNMSIEQSTSTIEVIAILSASHAPELEQKLHQRYAARRTQGEWFDLTDTDIDEIRSI